MHTIPAAERSRQIDRSSAVGPCEAWSEQLCWLPGCDWHRTGDPHNSVKRCFPSFFFTVFACAFVLVKSRLIIPRYAKGQPQKRNNFWGHERIATPPGSLTPAHTETRGGVLVRLSPYFCPYRSGSRMPWMLFFQRGPPLAMQAVSRAEGLTEATATSTTTK